MYKLMTNNVVWVLFTFNCMVVSASFRLDIWDDGPIVKGANITFTVVVYDEGNNVATGSFIYKWTDNAIPGHSKKFSSESGIDTWTVAYDAMMYPQGQYNAQVIVCKYVLSLICYEIGSIRTSFNVTESLNGNIALLQNNATRKTSYVSNADTVVHNVILRPPDAKFLNEAPTVLTYWFVDCTYYGFRTDLEFPFNYTQPDEEHTVEALIVADFTPLPPPTTTTAPTTTTTTVKPNATTTTSKPTTTPKPTAASKPTATTKGTTTNPTTSAPNPVKPLVKRDVDGTKETKSTSRVMVKVNGTLVPYSGTFPFVCNSTVVATDPKKTYGYFFKNVQVKAPVTHVNVTGNNWLQHGDLLTLNVKCKASKNLQYCVKYEKGSYNVTGNETCSNLHELETCEFTIQRYFIESTEHTIVIVIQNEVSRKVTPVTITVYKVKRQAQLSVIVVPVVFSLVAVVLIIFGVAYYAQNRSRFVVEVADFNFGQNYNDMEYKTFRERLRDSIANALFTRAPSPGSSDVPVWPPGRKYGSMTS